MRNILLFLLLTGSAFAQQTFDLTPKITGAVLDVKDGKATVTVQKVSVGTFIAVDNFKLVTVYQPSAKLLLSPVTTVLDGTMADTSMTIQRVALNLKPLQEAGVQLPGGFIASLIKAHLEAFDTREISLTIRTGKLAFAAKSGLVHTKLEATMGWDEGMSIAARVDAIKVNFGLPIPRPLIMKKLAFLDPLEWADVRENTIFVHVDKLAKTLAESLPAQIHYQLP